MKRVFKRTLSALFLFVVFSCAPVQQERQNAYRFKSSVIALDALEDRNGLYLESENNCLTVGLNQRKNFPLWDNANSNTATMEARTQELDILMSQQNIQYFWLWLYAWVDGTPKLTADKELWGRKAGENLIDLFSVFAPRYRFGADNLAITAEFPESADVPFLSYYSDETLFFINRGLTPTNPQNKLIPETNYTLELPLTGYNADWTQESRTLYFSTIEAAQGK